LTSYSQHATLLVLLGKEKHVLRQLFDDTHEMFRDSFRSFVQREVKPYVEKWEQDGIVDRSLFRKAGEAGFLGMAVPEHLGGSGVADFRFNAIMAEELSFAHVGASGDGILLHNDTCLPYLLSAANDEQMARWLPGVCSGELVLAIAMTEPGAGSDLAAIRTTARREGDHYVVNGAKTFITNGVNADLVILACKTDPAARHKGMSLLVMESGTEGFDRNRNIGKIGKHAQDTAELFFDDVRVPVTNLLGDEGTGFAQLVQRLPQERLSIAVHAVADADAAFASTREYCSQREAFGQRIGSFQHNKFALAEMSTELDIGQSYVDLQVLALNEGTLTAEDAARAKWWCTEMSWRVLDRCLQLHGGYGYTEDYPIARAWRDGRVPRIYGGTTEIMKEIIGRSLGF
jgi:alkylation response protein AidB-like acyl-CoA dehydrogenase